MIDRAQEALKIRDILANYKIRSCKKPDNQCKFKKFLEKDVGEILVLCTGTHNLAD